MYKGFFGLLGLTALVAAHCVYLWRGRAEKEAKCSAAARAGLIAAAVLYGAAVILGVVVVISGRDAVISHAAGILALIFALWFDSQFSRVCHRGGTWEES